ncbi:MAG: exosortase C-terminal domain/associated protein EpsI [Acidobacteriota bacterium]
MIGAYIKPMSLRPGVVACALALMAVTWSAAEWLRPRAYWADEIGDPHYSQLLPQHFGEWITVPNASAAVVNPVQAEMIERIYSETVARAYVSRRTGRAIMLSLAYGRDQSTDTQLHTPDMCYPSQGFRVESMHKSLLQTAWGALPAVQMQTIMGQRSEPLTYLVRTGDVVTDGSLQRNLARLGLAVRGFKMDGLLIRVSEVTRSPDAFEMQARFLNELLASMSDRDRAKFIGRGNH